jgi:mercuric ion transport protein
MCSARTQAERLDREAADGKTGWLAAGGVIGAMLASTCCIVPLALVTLGISGAWIGSLTALEPYKPIFAAAAIVFIGLGFRQVHVKSRAVCVAGSYCDRPASSILIRTALWLSTAVVVLALTVDWWARLFY